MKTLFTAEATSKGALSGTIQSPDGLLNLTLGNPLEKGIEKRGPNPELLFAGANSACYQGALGNAAEKLGILTYHVLAGKLMAANVKTTEAKTLNGQNLNLVAEDGKVTVDKANVIMADVAASNGVIQAIDTVLMPK
ncbi:MAG: hypothetical protein RL693_1512 [Verrucomicrobiota bacterium]|jgi:uncharacterized surface protein with fasciclin (FAS1) repeats